MPKLVNAEQFIKTLCFEPSQSKMIFLVACKVNIIVDPKIQCLPLAKKFRKQ